MPDLTVSAFWHCLSNEDWLTEVDGHTVIFDKFSHRNRKEVDYDYSCDCKSYQYRGRCKQIEKARPLRCGWSQVYDGGDVVQKDGKPACPKCGGPVGSAMHGV